MTSSASVTGVGDRGPSLADVVEGSVMLSPVDGRPVGMELVDRFGLLRDVPRRTVFSLRAERTREGISVTFSDARGRDGDWSAGRAMPRFARIVDMVRTVAAGGVTRGKQFETRCRTRVATGHVPGMGRGDADAFLAVAREAMTTAASAVEPFLSTLDQHALAVTSRLSSNRLDAEEYAALDTSIRPEAPLGRAVAAFPTLLQTLLEVRRRDPSGFDRAVIGGEGALRRHLVDGPRVMVTCSGGGARGEVPLDMGLALRFAALLDGLDDDARRNLVVEVNATQFCGDAAAHAAEWLSWLPASWFPTDGVQAMAFARCSPAIETVLSVTDVRDEVARILNVRGDWVDLLARLQGVSGPEVELETALNAIGDLATAYADQVLAPAVAISGGATEEVLPRDAVRMLLGTGTLRSLLETSRRWHAREAWIHQRLPPSGSGRQPDTWPAALPDAAYDGLRVVVLTDGRQLRDEGRVLDHCVGGYVGECLEGRSRILSVRDGDSRISTAQLTWETSEGRFPDVAQHLGPSNSPPPARAVEVLRRYVEDVRSRLHEVDEAALAPVPGGDPAVRTAGYDWRVPGHWEHVRDLWEPLLPRPLRGLAAGATAAAVRSVMSGVRPPPRRAPS